MNLQGVPLGLGRARACARRLAASGTAVAVLGGEGGFEINAGIVSQGGQPGEDVGEFAVAFLGRTAAQGRRQFADLLHEPHEGAFGAAASVFFAVDVPDDLLELH